MTRRTLFISLCLALATFLAYQPAWHAGFIWDDDSHLTRNPCIVGPLGFKEIWTSSQAVYYPLVLTSFWILHKFVGLNPLPYHLLNVLMHAGSAILLWRVLRALNVRGAWLGAALWALHPVMVQSVAWITELKNTQSCFFYLLSILLFLHADELEAAPRKRRWLFGLAFLFFAMAITSKASTVMLPVVLALCLWWRKGRLRWHDLALLAPLFLISLCASGWTIWEQKFHSGAIGRDWGQTPLERLAIAGRDIWFYLGKLVWPHPLIFIYPRWNIDAGKLITFLPTLTAAGGLFILWLKRNGWQRPLFFAAAYFVISLFPVLGFFNVYFFLYAFVSDHFQYLASIGPLALAGAGIAGALGSLKRGNSFVQPALCGLLLFTLGVLTWRQCSMYSDIETLYGTTIKRNPGCWLAYNNLGVGLLEKGQVDEAIAQLKRALESKSDYAEANNNLGNAFLQKGQHDEAMAQLKRALEIRPNYAEAHDNLGNVFLGKGQLDEAMAHYKRALEIKPEFAEAQNSLGVALLREGKAGEAMAHFQKAIEINPGYADAHVNLGNGLLQRGKMDEAVAHYRRALEIKPGYAQTQSNLGSALLQKGEVNEAIAHYHRALEIKPDYAEAHNNLGNALLQKGQRDEAIVHFERSLEINPNSAEAENNLGTALLQAEQTDQAFAHFQKAMEIQPANEAIPNNVAWVLASSPDPSQRNGIKAVEFAQKTIQLTGENDPSSLDTLAAAYAERGNFPEAIERATRALELAKSANDKDLSAQIEERLELYQRQKPYRQPAK